MSEHLRKQACHLLSRLARAYIVKYGYDPVYGARPLKRYIQKHVETQAARLILQGSVRAGDTIVVDVENDSLIARPAPAGLIGSQTMELPGE